MKGHFNKTFGFLIFITCALCLSAGLSTYVSAEEAAPEYFVQREGSQLILNGQPFHFNAANNDHLYHWSQFMISDVLEDAKGLGLTVLRVWASSEGQDSWKDGYCFQPNPREYNEPTFRQMDYIIAKAREKGIRLIMPLVNNWDDGFGGMPQYVKWATGNAGDWSGKTTLTFDLYNAGDAAVVDVAIRTGTQWVWHESLQLSLHSGWNYNISYSLTASNWKTEASGWQYTSPIADLNLVQTVSIGVFGYSHPAEIYIDNIRLDSQVYDGLEKIDNWYATDYSYSVSVELSTDHVSEGVNSLKMAYSYSAGEYNKAFAEKRPQVEKDIFYTNTSCKQLYKDYIYYFLNRVNSITGRIYKDDPTILMWELANEPRCESDPSGDTLQAWIDEMAGYIKSIDSNHLVSTGEEGWYDIAGSSDWRHDGRLGADYIRNNQSPYIDVCSFHLYPEGYGMSDTENLGWIQEHVDDAHSVIGKPVYLGEFGITADRKAAILNGFDFDQEGWSIDWNYSQGPTHVESPSRDGDGAILYTANINAVNTSCGGRIVYPEQGIDYSGYDYLSGWVYIPAYAPSDLTTEMYVYTGTDWKWASGSNVPLAPGAWTQVRIAKSRIESWGADMTKIRSLGIQIKRANSDYTGEVYYDVIGANVKDIYSASYQMSRRNRLYTDWFGSLNTEGADGAAFWQLFAHQDDGSLFQDYWNWAVYYPEDTETSNIIQDFSTRMNDRWIVQVPGAVQTNEREALQFSILATDPGNTSLIFTASGLPGGATFVDNGDSTGTFSWTPSYAEAGNYTVHIDIAHGVLTYSRDVSITVRNVLVFGTIYQSVSGVISPLEGADVSVMDLTRTNTFASATTNGFGKYSVIGTVPDGNYIIRTSKSGYNTYPGITILRRDQALPFSATLYAPSFVNVPDKVSIPEQQPYFLTISASDQNNDRLAITAAGLPDGAVLTDKGNNTAEFNWTPSGSQTGTHDIYLSVTDGLFSNQATMRIEVTGENEPPVMEAIPDSSVYEGRTLKFTVKASDPDTGDILRFSSENLPQGSGLDIFTGVFSWTPGFSQQGIYSMTFKVSDSKGLSDSRAANVTATNSSLYGTVFDGRTNMPVPGACVKVLKGFKIMAGAMTDSSGRYVIAANLPTGTYLVYVTAPHRLPRITIIRLTRDKTTALDFTFGKVK